MPSPFPGMDPYIEQPEGRSDFHSDFHSDLAAEIRAELNKSIQPQYVARLVQRATHELVKIEKTRSVRPDIGVWQPLGSRERERESQVAAISPAPVQNLVAMELPLRPFTIELHDSATL